MAQKKDFTYKDTGRSKRKKTRQGSSHNTKLKKGQKKYRGQGR